MRKYYTLLLLIGLSCLASFSETPTFTADYNSPICIFRLTDQLMDELCSKDKLNGKISADFFGKVVGDNLLVAQWGNTDKSESYGFYSTKRKIDSMAYGNYLLARLDGREFRYDYYSTTPYRIALTKEHENFALFLYDSLGHVLPDAEVSVEGERLPFNASTQRYEAQKHYDKAKVRILHHGYLSYFDIEKESDKWAEVVKKRPFTKFFKTIGRIVKDPVVSIRKYEPVGYIAKICRLGIKIEDRIDDYDEDNEYEYRSELMEYYDYETGEYMYLDDLRGYDSPRYRRVMKKCVRRDKRHGRELSREEEEYEKIFGSERLEFSKKKSVWVTSMPKYKPNDTVRVKGFVYRKNRRYNRPISVSLSMDDGYWRSSLKKKNRIALTERLEPYSDGVYTYDFALSDSLELRLDKRYHVTFWDSKGRVVGNTHFRYEDYDLRDVTLQASYDQPVYYKGDSVRVKVKALDANGLPFADALVKVRLQLSSVDLLLEPRALYAPELASQNKMTNGEEELTFVFPPSVAAENNISFQAIVSFSLPDGKVEEKKLNSQKYYTKKHDVSITLNKDSLLMVARYNGKDTTDRAAIYVQDAFGNKARLVDTTLPCALRLDPSYAKYEVDTRHARTTYTPDASSSLASVQWRVSGDSLFPVVANALHVPMVCYVIKSGEVIFSGSAQELPAYYPWDQEESYILRAKILWTGVVRELSDIVRATNKDVLRIAVDEPTVITPGMSCEMEVQVTDVEGNPVKNADVTAYAINSQFKTSSPNWNVGGSYLDAPTMRYKNYQESSQGAYLNSENYPLWRRLVPIDTIAYYHLLYPARDTIRQYSYYPKDSLTQISPFLIRDGEIQSVDIAYIDDVPCFIMSDKVPYSFSITPNVYHRIRLRTRKAEYTIDSVMVEPHKRTILSIDVNSTSTLVKRKRMRDDLTKKELERLKPYLLLFEKYEKYSQNNLVKEDGTILPVNETWRVNEKEPTWRFAGPVKDSVRWMTEQFDVKMKVDHNLVYSYDVVANRLKGRVAEKRDYPHLYTYCRFSLKDELQTLARRLMEDSMSQGPRTTERVRWSGLAMDYPQEEGASNSMEIRLDKKDNHIVLVPYKSELMPSVVYSYWMPKTFPHIEKGLYRIYVLNIDTTCYRMDSVVVESGKKTFVQFDPDRDRVMAEPFAAQLAKRLFFTYTNNDEWNLREKHAVDLLGRFLLNHDSFPFVALSDTLSSEEDVEELAEEIVIKLGYGSMRKNDLTGAVSTLSSSALSSATGVSVDQALQGRVSGVQVSSSSGQPGASATVKIRGASSLSGASEPLYVVDGKVVLSDASNSSLSQINPADIISMEVLKDDVATALYGSRAANGVIIIKTKNGEDTQSAKEPDRGGATLRTHFSDLGFWQPTLTTDKEGKARFKVTFPDDITRWQTIYLADAPYKKRVLTGSSEGSVKSFVPLSARLYMPEFLVKGDACWAHGKLTNYMKDTVQLTSSFSVNDSLVVTHPHRCGATVTDSLLLRAEGDSLSLVYQFVSENHFGDGERRMVKLLPQGLSYTEGQFAILRDTLSLSLHSEKGDSVTVRVMNTQSDLLQDEVAMLTHYPYGCNEQTTSKLIGFMTANQNPDISNHQRRANEKQIEGFVKTLKERQLSNGLWGWWGTDESSYWISRYIVETLQQYHIDFPHSDLRYTCLNLIGKNSSCRDKLFGLSVLHSLGERLDYKSQVDELDTMKNMTLRERLDLAELKVKCGLPIDEEWLNKYRRETMKEGVYYQFSDDCSVHSNEVMNTLQVYRILRADTLKDHKDELRKMRDYFYQRKSLSATSHWRNTYESAMMLRTLSEDVKRGMVEKETKVRFSGALQGEIDHFPYVKRVPAGGRLSVSQNGSAPVYLSVSSSYWDVPVEARGKGFSIQTNLSDSVLTVGKQVKMKVVVTVEKDAEYVLIHVPIPAGCTYASKEQSWRNNEVYREYYKEHTNIFCSSLKGGKYEFTIELSPYCAGNYTLNPVKVEQMYAPEFNGCTEMKRVRIVEF